MKATQFYLHMTAQTLCLPPRAKHFCLGMQASKQERERQIWNMHVQDKANFKTVNYSQIKVLLFCIKKDWMNEDGAASPSTLFITGKEELTVALL